MTRKPRRRVQTVSKKRSGSGSSPKTIKKRAAKPRRTDDLDAFITAAAKALDLPVRKAWLPAIKANLQVTLQLGSVITAFELPDDAEPAPVFRA